MRALLRSIDSCTCSCVLEQTSNFLDTHALYHLLDLLLGNVQYRSCKINIRPCSVALLPIKYHHANIFESLHLLLHIAVRSLEVIGLCCKRQRPNLPFLCIIFCPTHVRQRCVEDIAALLVRSLPLLGFRCLSVLCSTSNVQPPIKGSQASRHAHTPIPSSSSSPFAEPG